MKILVVGAGFSGAVIARELAEQDYIVDVIDQRNHIAGNCYDYVDDYGIRIHKYGPHAFHTNNKEVVDWVTRFGKWEHFELNVKAQLADGSFITFPLKKSDADKYTDKEIINIFFKPYSEKMWGIPFDQLNKSIISRIPRREDDSEDYFPNDKYKMLPVDGYTSIFKNIFDHNNINVRLNYKFNKDMEKDYYHVFNSMAIDEYFNYCHGELPYRSLKFNTLTLPMTRVLPCHTVNFTHTGKYTRIVEWKNWDNHGENPHYTTLTYEEPCDYKENNMERYYPVKDLNGVNREIYKLYKGMVKDNITFIGRCGQYVYVDMHQAISSALATVKNFIKKNKGT